MRIRVRQWNRVQDKKIFLQGEWSTENEKEEDSNTLLAAFFYLLTIKSAASTITETEFGPAEAYHAAMSHCIFFFL